MPKIVKKMTKRIWKNSKRQRLLYLWSREQAIKEGLYFPKRRIRIGYPSKVKILKRIESQQFKGATEQQIKMYFVLLNISNSVPETRDDWLLGRNG